MEMTKAFYIVQTREDWYRLHLTSTHYCLGACPDIESLLRTVKRLTKKYRTEQKLLRGLSHMEDKGLVNDSTREVYEQDYLAYHREHHDTVVKTVREALDEVKFDTPFHRAMKRTRRLVPVVTETSAKDIEERPEPVLVARKPRLKRW